MGRNLAILGPKILRDIAKVMRTIMSNTPRKIGENEYGGEFRVYLRDDNVLLTA